MIRRAIEKDIPDMTKLLYQVNQVHADGRPDLFKSGGIKYTEEDLKELIRDDNRPIFVHVAEDDHVDGYAFTVYENSEETTSVYAHKTLYIDDLCVDETRRGTHIGQQLYEHVCQVAADTGCYRVTLHVWALNPGAEAFYRKMGLENLYIAMEKVL